MEIYVVFEGCALERGYLYSVWSTLPLAIKERERFANEGITAYVLTINVDKPFGVFNIDFFNTGDK
jgi:hypothetical protein